MLTCVWANMEAKEKPIKYGKYVIYTGDIVNKEPCGNGILTISSKGSTDPVLLLSGLFKNSEVTDGTMTFIDGYTFKGDLIYSITEKPLGLSFKLISGELYDKDAEIIGAVKNSHPVLISVSPGDVTHIIGNGDLESRAPVSGLTDFIKFARDTSYTIDYGDCISLEIKDADWEYIKNDFSNVFTVVFSNGTKISHDENNQELWKKPNGEFINIDFENEFPALLDYRINVGDDYIAKDNIRHKFENGNIYEGAPSPDFQELFSDYRKLVELKTIDWKWEDFSKGVLADGGKVSYSDGSRYEGSFSDIIAPIKDDVLPESAYKTGILYGKDGKVVHEYKNGKNEVQLAEEDRKAAEEKRQRQLAYEESLKTDYLEFDKKNPKLIQSFKKTYPDGSVIEGIGDNPFNPNLYDAFKMTYPDGTIFEASNIIPSTAKFFEMNFLSLEHAPYFSDVILFREKQSYTILCGTWLFPDGFQVIGESGGCSFEYKNKNNIPWDYVGFYLRVQDDNGDFALLRFHDVEGHRLAQALYDPCIKKFRKTFPDYLVVSESDDMYGNHNKGYIRYGDGSYFEGEFDAIYNNGGCSINYDPRMEVIGCYAKRSLDNITGVDIFNGRKYDSNGKLIEIYEKGEKVSDFRFAQILATDKAELEKKEAAIKEKQKREKAYEDDCKKYGKKYVDAWLFENTFLYGTPEEYLVKCLNIEPYYESERMRSYHLTNLFGDLLMTVDVDKATRKVTYVYDHRK